MRRLNNKPVDMRVFECPQCHKTRMVRPLDHKVSTETREYKAKDGQTVTLLIDVCDHCKTRNFKQYFEPTKADIRRVIKAIQSEAALPENQSLEDLL